MDTTEDFVTIKIPKGASQKDIAALLEIIAAGYPNGTPQDPGNGHDYWEILSADDRYLMTLEDEDTPKGWQPFLYFSDEIPCMRFSCYYFHTPEGVRSSEDPEYRKGLR